MVWFTLMGQRKSCLKDIKEIVAAQLVDRQCLALARVHESSELESVGSAYGINGRLPFSFRTLSEVWREWILFCRASFHFDIIGPICECTNRSGHNTWSGLGNYCLRFWTVMYPADPESHKSLGMIGLDETFSNFCLTLSLLIREMESVIKWWRWKKSKQAFEYGQSCKQKANRQMSLDSERRIP